MARKETEFPHLIREYEPIPPMSAVAKIELEARVTKNGMYFLEDKNDEYRHFTKWPNVVNVNGYAYGFVSQKITRRLIEVPNIKAIDAVLNKMPKQGQIKASIGMLLFPPLKKARVEFSVATYKLLQKIVRVSEDSMFDGM